MVYPNELLMTSTPAESAYSAATDQLYSSMINSVLASSERSKIKLACGAVPIKVSGTMDAMQESTAAPW